MTTPDWSDQSPPLEHAIGGHRALKVGVLALGLIGAMAGCGLDARKWCEGAGGTYTGTSCTRSAPGERAAEDACEARGGVYLRGQDRCEVGGGGP
jgi:hypothetical protein